MTRGAVRVRRIYAEPDPDDGLRVLVDRLWPRGVSKERADLDDWFKQVSPSSDLRRWYGHDPEKFAEFARRYRDELREDQATARALDQLRDLAESATVTLLTATKDPSISAAQVLAEVLAEETPS